MPRRAGSPRRAGGDLLEQVGRDGTDEHAPVGQQQDGHERGLQQLTGAELVRDRDAATIEVGADGNFYTSNSILPAEGTFPQIKGTSGNVQNMPQLCLSGNCNSCHGVNNLKIWIN